MSNSPRKKHPRMLCQDLALDPTEVRTAIGNELVSDPNSKSKL